MPASLHLIEAARGLLYSSASSPKEPPGLYLCTGVSPFCFKYTAYSPERTTK